MQTQLKKKIRTLTEAIIDQNRSHVIVKPKLPAPGYWFGAGNLLEDKGNLLVCGRYRNSGDSRTGLGMGERGAEWAAFLSVNNGESWTKILSRTKESLSTDAGEILSIEGSHLLKTQEGYTLFISTEKKIEYPAEVRSHQKTGTGIWSIDIIQSETLEGLEKAPVRHFLKSDEIDKLHIKDPSVYTSIEGEQYMTFSSHPFSWASSNTGFVSIENLIPQIESIRWDFLPRGNSWDVAISRGTSLWDLPPVGVLEGQPRYTLMMYDGGECMQRLKKHFNGMGKSNGYSCEELGGSALFRSSNLQYRGRISDTAPQFISPFGTGSSRYVSLLETEKGLYATWQQSGASGEQALVMNFLSREEIYTILSWNQFTMPYGTRDSRAAQ